MSTKVYLLLKIIIFGVLPLVVAYVVSELYTSRIFSAIAFAIGWFLTELVLVIVWGIFHPTKWSE
jgi:hypothetical protein